MTRAVELAQVASNGVSEAFKNRIINGAMVIDQRNAGASVTITNTSDNVFTLDRQCVFSSQASKFSVQQSSVAPTGFSNSLLITSLSAYSVLSSDRFQVAQFIEGFNTADLAWGTADAKTVTLSFWVRSSLTGTFGGSFVNSAVNRSYPFTYTISSANTWEQKSITVAGDTSGTWLTTNGLGIRVVFGLGAGSNSSGTAGAWAGSGFWSATGATSVVGTNGATFYLTGVQLEVGSTATSFDYRPYGTELALCQRYYQKLDTSVDKIPCFGTGSSGDYAFSANILMVQMRAQPTLSISNAAKFDEYYVATRTQSSAMVNRNSGDTKSVIAAFGNFSGITRGNPGAIQDTTLNISAEL